MINLNESNCNHAGGGRHLHVRHRTAAGWNAGVNIQERDGPQRPHQRRRHADEPDGDRLFSPLYIALFLEGEQLSNGSADSRNAAPLGLQTKTTTTNSSNSGSWGLSGVRGSAPRRIFGCFAMVLSIV